MSNVFQTAANVNARNAWAGMQAAGLGWSVEQWPLYATNGQVRIASESRVMNVRSDTLAELGIVSVGFQIVQNEEIGALAQEIMGQEASLTFSSAREVDGGKRIIVELSGSEFGPTYKEGIGRDAIQPKLAISNGHDGGTTLEIMPSTYRHFCKNQLPLLRENHQMARIALRHTLNIGERVEAAKRVLAQYRRTLDNTRELVAKLGSAAADQKMADTYFLENFSRDYFAPPSATGELTSAEKKLRERAVNAYTAFRKHLGREVAKWGWNVWAVMNAYTAVVQHDMPNVRQSRTAEGRARKAEQLAVNNVFGVNNDRTHRAFVSALALVA